MPRYDSFLSLQSTPWFQAQFDLTLAALGKKCKKAARGVRFKSGLISVGKIYSLFELLEPWDAGTG